MDFIDYRERLGLGFHDEQKTSICVALIQNYFEDLRDSKQKNDWDIYYQENLISYLEYKNFCNTVGKDYGNKYENNYTSVVFSYLKTKSDDFKTYLACYIALLNCLTDRKDAFQKQELLVILEKAFKESHILYALLKDEDEYFIFPKGAKQLDDTLVSEVLEWLNEYPETKAEWVQALKDYSSVTEENASDVADKFRKSLERFFQEFFNKKDKNLENLKSDYGKFMESKGVPTELSNNFQNLLEAYTKFMNNHAKHQNKTSKNTLEYIMYQTGNIIRFLITLNK